MKLIVGLGNPGELYAETRHNVGFWAIDKLAQAVGTSCRRQKWRACIAECRIGDEKVILCKPQTYMNASGESVREILDFYPELDPESDLILIYDDLDFAPGQIKLRQKGSAGGHNGVKSIIQHVGGEVFPRIRVGIGRPEHRDLISYVLGRFSPEDRAKVDLAVGAAVEAVQYALETSFEQAMNRYNAVH
ncbi:MAG: aminoacyl-tRNA hydrolase [Alicyclobacillus herbarius]|uniref:aminoacyl-tRNA hydrolase n=1 Tax=Alicyclobacillus herbarius TaxID=122960 RepID=UPI000687B79B|nr:aminoacyl-tRNA hydrolase [Alicyclobacillus herbarius]MCL6632524.1 aminoacyl-tRNA hydrolase [Alicyclobacillus herbarius]